MMQSNNLRVNCVLTEFTVLLVHETLLIYIVKFVNRQVRQCMWYSGSVIFFFLSRDRVYKIMKYLIYPFLINRQSICQTLSIIDSFDCRHLTCL